MIKYQTFISYLFLVKYLLEDDNISSLSLFFKNNFFDKKLARIFLEEYYVFLRGLTLKCFNYLTDTDLNDQIEYWGMGTRCRFFQTELYDLLTLFKYLFELNISICRFSSSGTDSELFISCMKSRGGFEVETYGYKCLFFIEDTVLVSCFRKVFSLCYSNLFFSWETLPISFINQSS